MKLHDGVVGVSFVLLFICGVGRMMDVVNFLDLSSRNHHPPLFDDDGPKNRYGGIHRETRLAEHQLT
jgi:hypothetical protein